MNDSTFQNMQDILDNAYKKGIENEKTCTGCAQSTIDAVQNAIGVINDDVFKSASGLADGIGLTGDGSCGALAGGTLMIGQIFGRERNDFRDILKPMKSYRMAKELHKDFIERYGTCRCYDIQKNLMGRSFNLWDPNDMQEAIKHGMPDACSKVVGNAAKKTAELILRAQKGEFDTLPQSSFGGGTCGGTCAG